MPVLSFKSLALALKERLEDIERIEQDIAKGKLVERNELEWAKLDAQYAVVDLEEAKEHKLYPKLKFDIE